jgi:gamma-glutamyl-gamma-aminobutyrate hydrolase PuuD
MELGQITPINAQPLYVGDLLDGKIVDDPRLSQYSGVLTESVRDVIEMGGNPIIIPDGTSVNDMEAIAERIDIIKYESELFEGNAESINFEQLSEEDVDDIFGTERLNHKPIIGIFGRRNKGWSEDNLTDTAEFDSATLANITLIRDSGGIPIIFPNGVSEEYQRAAVYMVDGVVFTGGGDIDKSRSGVEDEAQDDLSPEAVTASIEAENDMPSSLLRDEDEIRGVRTSNEFGKVILAICRGLQINIVANGGTLKYIDDVNADPNSDTHYNAADPANNLTRVKVLGNLRTKFGDIIQSVMDASDDTVEMPMAHHMAGDTLGEGQIGIGYAVGEYVIPKFVTNEDDTLFAMQGHPEFALDSDLSKAIGTGFIEAARQNGRSRGRLRLAS